MSSSMPYEAAYDHLDGAWRVREVNGQKAVAFTNLDGDRGQEVAVMIAASLNYAFLHGVVRDKCEFCLGAKGGVNGNENVRNGVVVCDYCSVLLRRVETKPLMLLDIPFVDYSSATLRDVIARCETVLRRRAGEKV